MHLPKSSRSEPTTLSAMTFARATGSLGHPNEQEFLWLQLISWIDDEILSFAKTEMLTLRARLFGDSDPRLDRVRPYWQACDDRWKQDRPIPLPGHWRQAALVYAV